MINSQAQLGVIYDSDFATPIINLGEFKRLIDRAERTNRDFKLGVKYIVTESADYTVRHSKWYNVAYYESNSRQLTIWSFDISNLKDGLTAAGITFEDFKELIELSSINLKIKGEESL